MADQQEDRRFWEKRVTRAWIFTGNAAWSFDAVIRESHHHEVAVVTQPVETGVPVTDHSYRLPWHLEIEAIVTDFARGPNNPIPGDPFASAAGRSVKAMDMILSLMPSEPFQVQTGLRLYDNAVITTFDADQDDRTASALKFRVGLQEVIRVSTETVTYPPRADKKTTNRAAKKTVQGQKTTPPAPAAVEEAILHNILFGDSTAVTKALGGLGGLGGLVGATP